MGHGLITSKRETLHSGNVLGLKSFWSVRHFEFDQIGLFQSLEPVTGDFLEVNEHIFTRFTLDETEAFCFVEPLNCPFFQGSAPYKDNTSATCGHGMYIQTCILGRKKMRHPSPTSPGLRSLLFSYGFK